MKKYNSYDIDRAFKDIGLSEGDVVFVTTGLGMLGSPEGIRSQDELSALFYRKLLDFVGDEGTLIVPAYSYTFGKHRRHSPAFFNSETPSEIGPFSNYVLRQNNVYRSKDPFMSVLAVGKYAKEITDNIPSHSYGYDSVFERLLNYDSKCVTIGLGPNWTPFIHYLDWLKKVPFRYDKLFAGFFGDDTHKSVWLYTVPVLAPEARSNAHDIATKAEMDGVWHYSELGRARVYFADYREYFEYCRLAIDKDPWLFATEKNWDVLETEKKRINYNLPRLSLKDFINEYDGFCIAPISEEADYMMSFLGYNDWNEIEVKSGDSFFDHIIPEGWKCSDFSIKSDDEIILNGSKYVQPFSQSFQGTLSGREISEHINIESSIPSYIDRDWNFYLPDLIEDNLYDIDLSCFTYMSNMKIKYSGSEDSEYALVIDLSNHAGREILYRVIKEKDLFKDIYNMASIFFVTGPMAMSVILEKFCSLEKIFYLKDNVLSSMISDGFNPNAEYKLSDLKVKEHFIEKLYDFNRIIHADINEA